MEEQLLHSSKLASIGRLTAGISHEIGNPLASISSLVQELRAQKLDSEDDIKFTETSLKTINSILNVLLISSGASGISRGYHLRKRPSPASPTSSTGRST